MKNGWLEVDGWHRSRTDDATSAQIGRVVDFGVPNKMVQPEMESDAIWASCEPFLMLGSEATTKECCKGAGGSIGGLIARGS